MKIIILFGFSFIAFSQLQAMKERKSNSISQEITEFPEYFPDDIKDRIFYDILIDKIHSWKIQRNADNDRVALLNDMLFFVRKNPQTAFPIFSMVVEKKPHIIKYNLNSFIQFLKQSPKYDVLVSHIELMQDVLLQLMHNQDRAQTLITKIQNREPIRQLLEDGVDISCRLFDEQQITPLHFAAIYNHVEAINSLLDAGMNIDIKAKNGETPLHRAAYKKNINALKVLITAGASVNAQDAYDNTPLHYAVWDDITPFDMDAHDQQQKEAVRILIEAGSAINARNNEGKKPLDAWKHDERFHAMIDDARHQAQTHFYHPS